MATRVPSSIVRGMTDFDVEAALGRLLSDGRVPLQTIGKFGTNPEVGTTKEGIWSVGGSFNWLEAPENIQIASGGDVGDDAAGDGARTIIIKGIDENLKLSSETLITAGAAASTPSVKKYWRIWLVQVETVGLYSGTNIDTVVIESSATSTTLGQMLPGDSTSLLAQISTPDDHFALVRHVVVSVEGNKVINLDVCLRSNFDDVTPPMCPFIIVKKFIGLNAFHTDTPKSLLIIPPMSDFFFRGATDTGTSAISVGFDVLLVPLI